MSQTHRQPPSPSRTACCLARNLVRFLVAFCRHTKLLAKNRQRLGVDPGDNPFYSFTDEDQQEQLQIFVDWLHSQRVSDFGLAPT